MTLNNSHKSFIKIIIIVIIKFIIQGESYIWEIKANLEPPKKVARAKQSVHWFLGGRVVVIQQENNVWVGWPCPQKCMGGSLDLGKATHTLAPCRMPTPLPPRNQCTDGSAPTLDANSLNDPYIHWFLGSRATTLNPQTSLGNHKARSFYTLSQLIALSLLQFHRYAMRVLIKVQVYTPYWLITIKMTDGILLKLFVRRKRPNWMNTPLLNSPFLTPLRSSYHSHSPTPPHESCVNLSIDL